MKYLSGPSHDTKLLSCNSETAKMLLKGILGIKIPSLQFHPELMRVDGE